MPAVLPPAGEAQTVDKPVRPSLDTHGGIVKGGGYAPLHVQSMPKWELFRKFPFWLFKLSTLCRQLVLPPAGEAPAKRVMRENLGSLPAVRNVVFSSEYAEEHAPTPGKAHSIARRSIPAGPDTLLVFASLLSLPHQ